MWNYYSEAQIWTFHAQESIGCIFMLLFLFMLVNLTYQYEIDFSIGAAPFQQSSHVGVIVPVCNIYTA